MKINEEVIGKEVVDKSGDMWGIVMDVEWNWKTNKIEYILLKEDGITSKLGLGTKEILPYESIDAIGEKILVSKNIS
jgi:sporulation protein YlmC with PRC-barrel domain